MSSPLDVLNYSTERTHVQGSYYTLCLCMLCCNVVPLTVEVACRRPFVTDAVSGVLCCGEFAYVFLVMAYLS